MNMQTLLEEDKERFLQSIIKAKNAERATEEVKRELSRILFSFNEKEDSETVKAAAYRMIETASAASALMDRDGVTKIYGKSEYKAKEKEKKPVMFWTYLMISVGCFFAAVIICVMNGGILKAILSMPVLLLLFCVGLASTFFAGTKMHSSAKQDEQLFGETTVDAQKVYHNLFITVIKIDKLLEDIRSQERLILKKEMHESDGGLNARDIDLFAQILEDAYGDPDNPSSQEIVSHIRFYLHQKMISLVEYSEKNQSWFDMMPSKDSATLRPAIVLDGKLLKKGLAAGGR